MKTIFISIATIFIFLFSSSAQSLDKMVNEVQKNVEKEVNKYTKKKKKKALTNDEIIRGLKEALHVGTNNSSSAASKVDGFYKNPLVTIPFPAEAEKIKNTVVNLGMQKQVNDFVMTMNRAAEEASKEAAPVFLNAITSMSIQDGFGILKGADNAATNYLQNKTSSELTAKFLPIVKNAIDKVQVTKYWNPIINTYNRVGGVEKQHPNLEQYITIKTLEGLFKLIAGEEKKIRTDPIARVSDLLKKVFGSK